MCFKRAKPAKLLQGDVPVSLAEFTLDAGDGHTYYDISLVDGYNLPIAMVLQPLENVTLDDIPPNLTNPSCQGTSGLLAAKGYDPYPEFPKFLEQTRLTRCHGRSKSTKTKSLVGVPGICSSRLQTNLAMACTRIQMTTSSDHLSIPVSQPVQRTTSLKIAVPGSTTLPVNANLANIQRM